jgi:hypothetical protein
VTPIVSTHKYTWDGVALHFRTFHISTTWNAIQKSMLSLDLFDLYILIKNINKALPITDRLLSERIQKIKIILNQLNDITTLDFNSINQNDLENLMTFIIYGELKQYYISIL